MDEQKDGDIEDLFDADDYLKLYNRAFGTSIGVPDLKGSGSIVRRIMRHQGIEQFDHGRPADVLLQHRDGVLAATECKYLCQIRATVLANQRYA